MYFTRAFRAFQGSVDYLSMIETILGGEASLLASGTGTANYSPWFIIALKQGLNKP